MDEQIISSSQTDFPLLHHLSFKTFSSVKLRHLMQQPEAAGIVDEIEL